MYHALTNVQSGDSLHLPQYIDNRDGLLRVGLRSITFTVGWYNVHERDEESIWYLKQPPRGQVSVAVSTPVRPGLYGFDDLKALIEANGTTTLDLNKISGLVTLTVANAELILTAGLARFLGLWNLQRRRIGPGTYLGTKFADLGTIRSLHVYLEQINTSDNYEDGRPSTLLASVGIVRTVVFGDIEHAEFPNSPFKRLQDGTIHELKVVVCDDKGNPIDNHGQAISVELEIKKE